MLTFTVSMLSVTNLGGSASLISRHCNTSVISDMDDHDDVEVAVSTGWEETGRAKRLSRDLSDTILEG